MAYIGQSPKVKRLRFTPQSTIPSNPQEGDSYYEDGTNDIEGLYLYINSAWILINTGPISPSFTAVTKTNNATLATTGEDIVLADSTAGNITMTLPAVSGNAGLVYRIIKTVAANVVTIDANSTELINEVESIRLATLQDSVTLVCDGTQWYISTDDREIYVRTTRSPVASITSGALATTSWVIDRDTTNGAMVNGVFTAPESRYYLVDASAEVERFDADTTINIVIDGITSIPAGSVDGNLGEIANDYRRIGGVKKIYVEKDSTVQIFLNFDGVVRNYREVDFIVST